jgi:hypothetical protein
MTREIAEQLRIDYPFTKAPTVGGALETIAILAHENRVQA